MYNTVNGLTESRETSKYDVGEAPERAAEWLNLDNHPSTIVLQPCRELTQETGCAFQRMLEEALELALERVIVDMLWVEKTDMAGIAALVAGLEKAASLGKIVSFQAMPYQTRVAVSEEWERQRQRRLGIWHDRYETSLAEFLSTRCKQ